MGVLKFSIMQIVSQARRVLDMCISQAIQMKVYEWSLSRNQKMWKLDKVSSYCIAGNIGGN